MCICLRIGLSLILMLATGVAQAQSDVVSRDTAPATLEDALERIEKLEQMLREKDVPSPERPAVLDEEVPAPKLIVPKHVEATGLVAEVRAINDRTENQVAALASVRRAFTQSEDSALQQSAYQVLFAIESWAASRTSEIDALFHHDAAAAYMLAEDALQLVRRDPIGADLRDYVNGLQSDKDQWQEIRAMAHFRRIMAGAQELGLTGGLKQIELEDSQTRRKIRAVGHRLGALQRAWPHTEAGRDARAQLREWRGQEREQVAGKPAWRYTWDISLIQIGTDSTTTIEKRSSHVGRKIVIEEETEPVYDNRNVDLSGTFQNRSTQPYRYSFVVSMRGRSGVQRIQTPVLEPGEVYQWGTRFTVRSAYSARRVSVTDVEAVTPRWD